MEPQKEERLDNLRFGQIFLNFSRLIEKDNRRKYYDRTRETENLSRLERRDNKM